MDVMVCFRVGTRNVIILPGSTQIGCSKCGAICWISPASRKAVDELNLAVVCLPCHRQGPTAGVITITRDQLREALKSLHESN